RLAVEGVDGGAGEGGGGGRVGRGGAEGGTRQIDTHTGRSLAVDRYLHGRVVVGRGGGVGGESPSDLSVVHSAAQRGSVGDKGPEAELVGGVAGRHDVEGVAGRALELQLSPHNGERDARRRQLGARRDLAFQAGDRVRDLADGGGHVQGGRSGQTRALDPDRQTVDGIGSESGGGRRGHSRGRAAGHRGSDVGTLRRSGGHAAEEVPQHGIGHLVAGLHLEGRGAGSEPEVLPVAIGDHGGHDVGTGESQRLQRAGARGCNRTVERGDQRGGVGNARQVHLHLHLAGIGETHSAAGEGSVAG